MEGDAFSWKHIDSHFGQILGIKMDVRGDLIAVGDLMKSITLLRIDTSGEKLSELARDSEPNWMTEVRFISDMQLLGADNLGNVFVMERRRDPHFAGEKWKLVGMAGFHIGEVVNRIARGTLTRQGEQSVISNPHLLATTCGSIYLFGMLPIRQYSILKVVERNLNIVNNPIGGLSHSTWRALATERRKPRPMESFLDGDLIAKFLDLPSEDMKKLIAEGGRGKYEVTGGNVAEVTELIESLLAAYQ
jgi:DNA damage-binding protein 1